MPKPLKRPTSRPTSKSNLRPKRQPEWDDDAHVTLTRLFNEDHKRIESEGIGNGVAAHDALTLEFIDTHRTQLAYTPRFLRMEERVSAGVFLQGVWRRSKRKVAVPPVGTSRQLTEFATVYFPNFIPLLRIQFLTMLRTAETVDEITQHGLTRLAAAYLAGARDDAEREIRRIGGSLRITIIDNHECRIENKALLSRY